MAKRPQIDPSQAAGLFKKTEPDQPQGEKWGEDIQPGAGAHKRKRDPNDRVQPRGVALRSSEWQKLEQISLELGDVGLYPLLQWIVRDFIARYSRGEVKPPTTSKNVLK